MKLIDRTVRVCDLITDFAAKVAVTAMVLLFLLEAARIIFRYLFSLPLNWIPGLVALLTNWAVFLGVGVYLYKNEVLVIDYFYEHHFPSFIKPFIDFLVNLLVVIFSGVAIWYLSKVLQSAHHQSSLSTLKIQYFWFTLPFICGMILAFSGGIKRLLTVRRKSE